MDKSLLCMTSQIYSIAENWEYRRIRSTLVGKRILLSVYLVPVDTSLLQILMIIYYPQTWNPLLLVAIPIKKYGIYHIMNNMMGWMVSMCLQKLQPRTTPEATTGNISEHICKTSEWRPCTRTSVGSFCRVNNIKVVTLHFRWGTRSNASATNRCCLGIFQPICPGHGTRNSRSNMFP